MHGEARAGSAGLAGERTQGAHGKGNTEHSPLPRSAYSVYSTTTPRVSTTRSDAATSALLNPAAGRPPVTRPLKGCGGGGGGDIGPLAAVEDESASLRRHEPRPQPGQRVIAEWSVRRCQRTEAH